MEQNKLVLKTLNKRGKPDVRAAFVNWQTIEKDIATAIKELEKTYDQYV